jgi:hypothetical protein
MLTSSGQERSRQQRLKFSHLVCGGEQFGFEMFSEVWHTTDRIWGYTPWGYPRHII